MLRLVVNDSMVETAGHPGLPALDFLRDELGLSGVKHACREGDCGSCVILLGQPDRGTVRYRAVTSCLLPLGGVRGHHVVTVEGLAVDGLNPFQRALVEHGGSQCGFCTPGFVVSFAGLLLEAGSWELAAAVEAVAGNICRCTGYQSVVRSMESALERLRAAVDPAEPRVPALIREGWLPGHFAGVPAMLDELAAAAAAEPSSAAPIVIAGGTDLFVQRFDELDQLDVEVLVPPLDPPPIRHDNGHIVLAGSATAEDLKRSVLLHEHVGDVDRAMRLMGSLPIRHRATIAGNIVNASPIGDMTIVLLALGAEIELHDGGRQRRLPLDRFFLGYKTLDLRPGERVASLRFPTPGSGHAFNFEKVSKRTHLDIATVNTALAVTVADGRIAEARLAAGGVAPVPMVLERASAAMIGRPTDAATASAAAAAARAEVSPISDVRGSAGYKRLLLGQLVLAHFQRLFGLGGELVAETAS